MAEVLRINKEAGKADIYEDLLPQIESLVSGEDNLVANLANIAAALWQAFDHLWTGFYIREGDELILGPFQGPIACTRIPVKPMVRGVCGAAAESGQTIIVGDVEKFEGHIACSSESRSEIVVPLVSHGETRLVLDIDSCNLNSFDEVDRGYLEKIIEIIRKQHFTGIQG